MDHVEIMMWTAVVIRTLALLLAALASGALLVNWLGLARAMARLSAPAYVELHQHTSRTFDPYMPIVVIGALMSGVALAAVGSGLRPLSVALPLFGALCYAGVMAISLSVNVPINRQVARWSISAPPDHWATARRRWINFHILRTLLSAPALLSYVLAVALNSRVY